VGTGGRVRYYSNGREARISASVADRRYERFEVFFVFLLTAVINHSFQPFTSQPLRLTNSPKYYKTKPFLKLMTSGIMRMVWSSISDKRQN